MSTSSENKLASPNSLYFAGILAGLIVCFCISVFLYFAIVKMVLDTPLPGGCLANNLPLLISAAGLGELAL